MFTDALFLIALLLVHAVVWGVVMMRIKRNEAKSMDDYFRRLRGE